MGQGARSGSTAESAEGGLPLTAAQYMLWTGQKMEPEVPLYNMILTFDLGRGIDEDRFFSAWDSLVERCDALRSVIHEVEGKPVQLARKEVPESLERVDLSNRSEADVDRWIEDHSRKVLPLERCLYHSALIKCPNERYVWYLNQHHLYTDGWSATVVFDKMAETYALACEGRLHEAPDLCKYADYVKFEKEERRDSVRETRAYWDGKLSLLGNHKPTMYGRGTRGLPPKTCRVSRDIDGVLLEGIRELAKAKGFAALTSDVAFFRIFATTLFSWLAYATGSRKLGIGAPSHNRVTKQFKETAGVFIEIFPLIASLEEKETFRTLYAKVVAETDRFFRNARPGGSQAEYNRAFSVLLNYINASFSSFSDERVDVKWVHSGYGDREHAMRLQVHDFSRAGVVQLHFDMNEELFVKPLDQWAPDMFLRILERFVENPDSSLFEIDVLGAREKQALFQGLNSSGRVSYEKDLPLVPDLISRRVTDRPDRVAVEQGDRRMTYAELDAESDALAANLQVQGVRKGDRVALLLTRSVEAVVTMLASFKAGAVYVPLDPASPTERLGFLIEDTGAAVVVSEPGLRERLPEGMSAKLIHADTTESDGRRPGKVSLTGDSPAYIIHTSGSTGDPKGVVVDHHGLAGYVTWAEKCYCDGQALTFPLFSSLAFDLTVTSVFLPLTTGGTILVYPEEQEGGDMSVLRVIADDKVDIVKLTPAHLALILNQDPPQRIRSYILGGEDLRVELARETVEKFGGKVRIFNEYGPTEAVVGCMTHLYDPERDQNVSVPIGKPAYGVSIYLVNESGQPVPCGVPGEMVIGTDRLAQGYWNRPDLTAECFVEMPHLGPGRFYKTGDLARMADPQTMVFLGRRDGQVKVRGVRVELGEVEHIMAKHPSVSEVVVDVVRYHDPLVGSGDLFHCVQCGLPSNFPEVAYDDDGVCHFCREYSLYSRNVDHYFSDLNRLKDQLFEAAKRKTGEYDCLVLLSGGKDSTYMLYQLKEMGLAICTFTLDNGYISDGAKANIRRAVEDLGVHHVSVESPGMNSIFVDSLKRYSNVCNGCFKALYTLSMKEAWEKGIPSIVTGLSRGQFFETRLAPEWFNQPRFDIQDLDDTVLEARKAYHRMEDAVTRAIDCEVFHGNKIFEDVQFLDFYRYCSVGLEELWAFLSEKAPWVRPEDTGRSTNCLINEAGIYVHQKERGHHNYALPYSWDVRLGHKERKAAMEELDDRIDVHKVHRILNEIGYTISGDAAGIGDQRMSAYYVGENELSVEEWREYLGRRLPEHLIPSYFTRLERLPLTANGKVDRALLPPPVHKTTRLNTIFAAPESELEKELTVVWTDILKTDRVGLDDNFFDLGGDSIKNIQIVARCVEKGIDITPSLLFRHQTIRALAAAIEEPGESSSPPKVELGKPLVDLDSGDLEKIKNLLKKPGDNS